MKKLNRIILLALLPVSLLLLIAASNESLTLMVDSTGRIVKPISFAQVNGLATVTSLATASNALWLAASSGTNGGIPLAAGSNAIVSVVDGTNVVSAEVGLADLASKVGTNDNIPSTQITGPITNEIATTRIRLTGTNGFKWSNSGSNVMFGIAEDGVISGNGSGLTNLPKAGVVGLPEALTHMTNAIAGVGTNSTPSGTVSNITITATFTNSWEPSTIEVPTNSTVILVVDLTSDGTTNHYKEAVTWVIRRGTGLPEIVSTNITGSASVDLSGYVTTAQHNADTNSIFQASTNAANTRTTAATNGLWKDIIGLSSTNQGATVIALPAHGTRWQSFTTNANFAISALSNLSSYGTNIQQTVTFITNNSAATISFTVPADWIISGGLTHYVTNQGVLTVAVYPLMGTNAAWKCLK